MVRKRASKSEREGQNAFHMNKLSWRGDVRGTDENRNAGSPQKQDLKIWKQEISASSKGTNLQF